MLPEHLVTWLVPSIQRGVPAVPGVVKLVMVRKLLTPVLMVTPLVPPGVKVLWPLNVPVPVRVRAPGRLTVPVLDPSLIVVAAPPIFKVVATVLNRLAVVLVAVRSELEAPEMLTPFKAVSSPAKLPVPSTVR